MIIRIYQIKNRMFYKPFRFSFISCFYSCWVPAIWAVPQVGTCGPWHTLSQVHRDPTLVPFLPARRFLPTSQA